MKFLLAFAALAMGVSAQSSSATASASGGDSECLAEYILTRCLETETPKSEKCRSTDYNCLCAAYEAIATCYNNCPNDSRAGPARHQVNSFCAQVTTSSTISASTTVTAVSTDIEEGETSAVDRPTNTRSFSADVPENTNGAAEGLAKNAGSMLLGAAGIAALVI